MPQLTLETSRFKLILQSTDEVLAFLDSMSPEDRAQVSPAWIEMMRNSPGPNPWTHAFKIASRDDGSTVVGNCAFKGPPSADGIVEVAYGIDPEHQNQGIATEATQALVAFAWQDPSVRCVRAHTMENNNASSRVLIKCGFAFTGQVVDPEDGPVWRWDKERQSVSA